MREAIGRLVAAMSRVALPMTPAQHAKVLEALDENLRHPQQYIQGAAVEALRHYTRWAHPLTINIHPLPPQPCLTPFSASAPPLRAYVLSESDAASFREKHLNGYLTRLHDPNVAVRRGFASALGALPALLLGPRAEQVGGCGSLVLPLGPRLRFRMLFD